MAIFQKVSIFLIDSISIRRPKSGQKLFDLNQELGLTLIVTSHHMASSLRMADQIFLIRDRGCLSGSPIELAGSQDSAILEFIGEDGAEYLARHGPGAEGGG